MSTSYWMIEGIGLRALDVKPYINIEKAARFFHAQYPDDSDLAAMIAANDYSSFDLESFYRSNVYFYYPPSMPWHRSDTEPQSKEEVIARIIKAVQKITDMSGEEIKAVIDTDLYAVGMG